MSFSVIALYCTRVATLTVFRAAREVCVDYMTITTTVCLVVEVVEVCSVVPANVGLLRYLFNGTYLSSYGTLVSCVVVNYAFTNTAKKKNSLALIILLKNDGLLSP